MCVLVGARRKSVSFIRMYHPLCDLVQHLKKKGEEQMKKMEVLWRGGHFPLSCELHNSVNFSRLLGSKQLPIFVHIFIQQKYWVFQHYRLYDCVKTH